jgi:hypothetical protein
VPAPAPASAPAGAGGSSAGGPHAHITAAAGEDATTFHALDRKLTAAGVEYAVSTHAPVLTSEEVRRVVPLRLREGALSRRTRACRLSLQ